MCCRGKRAVPTKRSAVGHMRQHAPAASNPVLRRKWQLTRTVALDNDTTAVCPRSTCWGRKGRERGGRRASARGLLVATTCRSTFRSQHAMGLLACVVARIYIAVCLVDVHVLFFPHDRSIWCVQPQSSRPHRFYLQVVRLGARAVGGIAGYSTRRIGYQMNNSR